MARRASTVPAEELTATASDDHSMRETTAPSRMRSPSSAAILADISWVPPGKWSCWAPPTVSSMRSRPPEVLT